MRRLLQVLVLALATLSAGPAFAVLPDEVLPDPALEARARALSAELRCMVCQNQSIDDSNADLARDLRILLRERLVAGDTDEEVMTFLVDRYGEFILLRPRFNLSTAIAWLAGPVLLVAGGFLAFRVVRRRGESQSAPELSADEERRVRKLLGDQGPNG